MEMWKKVDDYCREIKNSSMIEFNDKDSTTFKDMRELIEILDI